jgi:hypothetical protein
MPLFNDQPTFAAALDQRRVMICGSANRNYDRLVEEAITGWRMLWEPGTELGYVLTVADVLRALDTEAVKVFERYGMLVAFLEQVAPGQLPEKYQSAGQPYDIELDADQKPTGRIFLKQA